MKNFAVLFLAIICFVVIEEARAQPRQGGFEANAREFFKNLGDQLRKVIEPAMKTISETITKYINSDSVKQALEKLRAQLQSG